MVESNHTKKQKAEKQKEIRFLYKVMSYAAVIPGMIILGPIVGYLIGDQIDKWLNTEPWFILLGIAFGFAAGIHQAMDVAKKVLKMKK